MCTGWGCATGHDKEVKPLGGGSGTEISLIVPWSEIALDPATERATVHATIGVHTYHAEYGADPTVFGSVGEATITHGGLTWRQSRGYFYIWGHWRMLETERTRTITWGTTAIGRSLPAGVGSEEREQLFVECGTVIVIPKDLTSAPVVVKQGEYVVIAGTLSGGITISPPQPTPSSTMPSPTPEELAIIEFLDKVRLGHSDPCNP